MTIRKIIALVPILLGAVQAQAQVPSSGGTTGVGSHYTNHYDRLTPETPNASHFTIYGDIPVDHSTGVPNISIPIYTLQQDGVQVPISISYHASGVMVDELSGPVGLKWTLNAGGAVFRTVKEMADEKGWLNANKRTAVDGDWFTEHPVDLLRSHDDMRTDLTGKDHFPDLFRYSLPGGGGSFQFDTMGNIMKAYTDGILLKRKNFEQDPLNMYFEAQDPQGVIYSYGGPREYNHVETISGNSSGSVDGGDIESEVTGWMLDRITSRNGRKINFSYLSYFRKYRLNDVSSSITKASDCVIDTSLPIVYGSESITRISTINRPTNQLIQSITGDAEEVNFHYSHDSTASTWQMRLDSITIMDITSGKEKQFIFSYGHYSGDHRLRLDSVQEIGFDGTSMPPYVFSYIAGDLPKKGDMGKDLSGYYNGAANSSLVPWTAEANAELGPIRRMLADRDFNASLMQIGTLETVTYPTGGKTGFVYEPNAAYGKGAHILVPKAVQLEEPLSPTTSNIVTYEKDFEVGPLGSPTTLVTYTSNGNNVDNITFDILAPNGTSIFGGTAKQAGEDGDVKIAVPGTYMIMLTVKRNGITDGLPIDDDVNSSDPNGPVGVYLDWHESTGRAQYAGGLRVASVSNYDETGRMASRRAYSYNGLETTNWVLGDYSEEYCVGSESCSDDYIRLTFSSRPIDIDPLLDRAGHFYRDVTVTQVDAQTLGGSPLTTIVQGTQAPLVGQVTEESYEEKYQQHSYASRMVSQRLLGTDGLPVSEREMEYDDTVLSTIHYWTIGDVDRCPGLYSDVHYASPRRLELGFSDPEERDYSTRRSRMVRDITRQFGHGDSGEFSTTVNYEYNVDEQVTVQETVNSEGGTLKVENFYTRDAPHLFGLVAENMVGLPIGREVFQNGQMVAGQYFDLDPQGNVVASYIYNAGIQTRPVGAQAHVPGGYEFAASYKIENGLPVEVVGRDGVPTAFVWGYDRRYVVAEVYNATSSAVRAKLAIAEPGATASLLTVIKAGQIGLVEGLKQALPEAYVTTYRYNPMVGIEESTGPNGRKSYYAYDGLGRLITVRDHDGNILQENEYHYGEEENQN